MPGNGVKRGGFDNRYKGDDGSIVGTAGDDHLTGGNSQNIMYGDDGDDVMNGKKGPDVLIGGDGEDDLTGGSDGSSDVFVPGDFDFVEEEVIQDAYSDDINAEATFEENGIDIIFGYDDDVAGGTDGIYDIIDFSDTFDFVDPSDDGQLITAEEKEAQMDSWLIYNSTFGVLGDTDYNIWFYVFDSALEGAATVYVEVDGDVFTYDGANWDLVA